MHKKFMGTAAALLLSLCIAAGGLCILRVGLEKEEESLLSGGGTVEQKSVSEDRQGEEVRYSQSDTCLSAEELSLILKKEEDSGIRCPHEPYYGQLSIEEAVERGKEWLNQLKQESSFLADLWQETDWNVAANLSRPGEESEMTVDSNRIFSSWHLEFYGTEENIYLEMNAVTGQILNMQINLDGEVTKIQDQDKEKLLTIFVSQFELEGNGEIEKEEGRFYQSLNEGQFYAVEGFSLDSLESYGAVSYSDSSEKEDAYGNHARTGSDIDFIGFYITGSKPLS